ncbi:hypothetical protein [Halorubellus sp. PRR65]|nr:hypothetical protein [Halorubellus sp. PRR65]
MATIVGMPLPDPYSSTVEMDEITVTRPPADSERYEELASIEL